MSEARWQLAMTTRNQARRQLAAAADFAAVVAAVAALRPEAVFAARKAGSASANPTE